jgi:replicative DNA helicase
MNNNGKFRRKPPATADRLPPHSDECERGVLGALLLEPLINVPVCIEKVKAGADVFYDLRHQTIYDAILRMYDVNQPINVITVMQHLKDVNMLEQVGGITYLQDLPDAVTFASELSAHLDIVISKFLLRKMIHACTNTVTDIYDDERDAVASLDKAERDVLAVRKLIPEKGTPPIGVLVSDAIAEIDYSMKSMGAPTGQTTGFIDLDKLTGGMQKGDMMILAGRPSLGKTSLAMNIVEHVALNCRVGVGIFSFEMNGKSLIKRMICSRARVNMRNLNDGFIAERDFPKLTAAAGKIHHSPIYIDDTRESTVMQIRARARRMYQEHGIGLIVVDYLQLIRAPMTHRSYSNRQEEITEISFQMKSLAGELNIPVMVISQLNREIDREKNRRPRLSDLRESGAIEQDADFVGILYKVKDFSEEAEESDSVAVNLWIGKQRSGPADKDVHLTFLKNFTRYESAAKITDDTQVDMEYGKR